MRQVLISLFLLASAACTTGVSASPPSFFGYEGAWRGSGTFQGMPSMVEVQVSPILEGGAWALDVTVLATPANGPLIRFIGRAQYVVRDGAPVTGNWVDSQGSAYVIAPSLENGALIVDWGEGASARGRSEYRLTEAGELRIDDFVPNAAGEQRRFATATLRRSR